MKIPAMNNTKHPKQTKKLQHKQQSTNIYNSGKSGHPDLVPALKSGGVKPGFMGPNLPLTYPNFPLYL